MDIQSARDLKQEILARIMPQLKSSDALSLFGIQTSGLSGILSVHSMALGLAVNIAGDVRIAVRLQRSHALLDGILDQIRAMTGGELDVRFIGRVVKFQAPQQQRVRPLRIGSSIGQYQVTAGTLGCFVESRTGTGGPLILSNNHVLANENRAAIGDAVLQPGKFDGGTAPQDTVATLVNFEPLNPGRPNLVDCAVAGLSAGAGIVPGAIDGVGALAGVAPAAPQNNDTVMKLGRTTGVTTGRITAIEVDNIVVIYDTANYQFDKQIEIEGAGNDAFSAGGDSGSLVVNTALEAVALLFSGTETGGSNNRGLTYASPIGTVLDTMNCNLVTQ